MVRMVWKLWLIIMIVHLSVLFSSTLCRHCVVDRTLMEPVLPPPRPLLPHIENFCLQTPLISIVVL